MTELTTAQTFLVWLTSTAGLGTGLIFIVGLIKKLFPKLEGWASIGVAVGVAVLLGGGATLILETGVYSYVEPYWGVIVAIATVIGSFATSQLVYHKAPRTNGE